MDKITKNSVGLSWEKPKNDGGSKITGYVIEKKKAGEDWVECLTLPAGQTSGTVPHLLQGEEYQFRVRAVNAAGNGEPSRPTNSIKAEDQPGKYCLVLTFYFKNMISEHIFVKVLQIHYGFIFNHSYMFINKCCCYFCEQRSPRWTCLE